MAYEIHQNPIKHKAPIPTGYSGRLADIDLDVITILGDDPLETVYDNQAFQALLKRLPLIEYHENKAVYCFKLFLVVIVYLVFFCLLWYFQPNFGVWTPFLAMFFWVIPFIAFRLSLFKIPKTKNKDNICVKIYQTYLEFKPKNAWGVLQKDFVRIDFKDIFFINYEKINQGNSGTYWAIVVNFLTYSDDGQFYKINSIELASSNYNNKVLAQFTKDIQNLWFYYWQNKDKSKLPSIKYIKQMSFEEFAKHKAEQSENYQNNWQDDDDW